MHNFSELNLGIMAMDEYENKLLELLKYVYFIQYEKVNIQRFLSGLPTFYKDRINYDAPSNLEEVIRKTKFMYNQIKGRLDLHKTWKSKMQEKNDQKSKRNFKYFVVLSKVSIFPRQSITPSGSRIVEYLRQKGNMLVKC